MSDANSIQNHLVSLLKGGEAYERFDVIVASVAVQVRGIVPKGAERSPWQILDHMRRTVRDLLNYCHADRAPYKELDWPADYWSVDPIPPSEDAWDKAVTEYLIDRRELETMASWPLEDLTKPQAHMSGHTYLREILLAADHQSYHLGELVVVQRLGA